MEKENQSPSAFIPMRMMAFLRLIPISGMAKSCFTERSNIYFFLPSALITFRRDRKLSFYDLKTVEYYGCFKRQI